MSTLNEIKAHRDRMAKWGREKGYAPDRTLIPLTLPELNMMIDLADKALGNRILAGAKFPNYPLPYEQAKMCPHGYYLWCSQGCQPMTVKSV